MPKYAQPRKTWQYTTDFKIKAVKLSLQDGLQVKQVAQGLDIHPFILSRWRKEYGSVKFYAHFFCWGSSGVLFRQLNK